MSYGVELQIPFNEQATDGIQLLRSNKQINAMTTIIVHYKTSDFLRFGLYAASHSTQLRWTALGLAVAVLSINVYQTRAPWEPIAFIATLLTTALFISGYLLLMLALTMLSAVLRNRKGSLAAEVQTYSLTDFGLLRKSHSSETLLKWGGARSLHMNGNAIYVAASASSYLILPHHSFASDDEYASMWNDLQRLARPSG